jgi:hypothetical protein
VTPLEILRAARAKIADPANWCQNNGAQDGDGNPVRVHSPAAQRWCIYGALEAVNVLGDDDSLALFALRHSCDDLLALFNDNHTHTEVLAVFDRAIVQLEGGL